MRTYTHKKKAKNPAKKVAVKSAPNRLVRDVMDWLNAHGFVVHRVFMDGMMVILALKSKRTYIIKPGEAPTRVQNAILDPMERAGAVTATVASLADLERIFHMEA